MGKDLFNPHLRKFSIRKLTQVFVLCSCQPLYYLGRQVRLALMKQALLVFKTRLLELTLLNHQQLLQHQQHLKQHKMQKLL